MLYQSKQARTWAFFAYATVLAFPTLVGKERSLLTRNIGVVLVLRECLQIICLPGSSPVGFKLSNEANREKDVRSHLLRWR